MPAFDECQTDFHRIMHGDCEREISAYCRDMHDPLHILDDVIAASVGERLRDNWSDERDICEAEWSSVVMSSRVLDHHVSITMLGGQRVQGIVTQLLTDAVLLDDTTLLPASGIATCRGVGSQYPRPHQPVRVSARAQLRSWVNRQVSAVLVDGLVLRGELRRVAADHVDLDVNGELNLLRLGAVQVWRVLG